MFQLLESSRVTGMKRAYTTRRVPTDAIVGLDTDGAPTSGDVIVARVGRIGQHPKLEAPDGRRQTLFPGDEILVCYANRYAPAQFEAVVPAAVGPCDLVAAGGVASSELCRHDSKSAPTKIEVVGFATGSDGRRLHLSDFAMPTPGPGPSRSPLTVVIAGTSMDSGKTTTAAGLIHGLTAAGLSVGAAKATGTGAGGDGWLMADAGAARYVDFVDVGMASTYLMDDRQIIDGFVALHATLAESGVDVAVIEVADGLYHRETRELLLTDELRDRCDAMVFAAGDAAGAIHGVEQLRAMQLPVCAVSGLLTASPLAVREARGQLDVPVLTLDELWSADHELLSVAAGPPMDVPVGASLAMAHAS